MAMGTKRARQKQEELFYASERAEAPGHPFYEQLNGVLDDAGFDKFCEEQCRDFYHTKLGRPSLAPGVYFRLLLIGFFEGIGSERGIGWRVADIHDRSLSRENEVLPTRATEERANTITAEFSAAICAFSARAPAFRRTRHPFAVSGHLR